MSLTNLKAVFDHHFQNTAFDNQFCKRVEQFVKSFLGKNDAHVSFFGGNLLGVHPVRWNYSDTDYWWDEVFDVMDGPLQQDLNKLPDIKSNRVVSSDVLNHAMIYSLYRIHHANISEDLKNKTKVRIMLALNMKFICSLAAHYFKYPADEGVAIKTYNKLSKRFDLKSTGSWGKMLLQRSEAFVGPSGRYYKSYTTYTDDIEIIKMLNDAQGRIRETFKEITAVYYQTLEEKTKVLSNSATVEIDGTRLLKDIERQTSKYIRYLKTTIAERDGYIKDELQYIVQQAVPSMNKEVYDKIQNALLDNYVNTRHSKNLNRMIDSLLAFSFELLKNDEIRHNDLPAIVYRLKFIYLSGRIKDESLEHVKQDFMKLAAVADKRLKGSPLVPERCAFFLYLILRTLTMSFYR